MWRDVSNYTTITVQTVAPENVSGSTRHGVHHTDACCGSVGVGEGSWRAMQRHYIPSELAQVNLVESESASHHEHPGVNNGFEQRYRVSKVTRHFLYSTTFTIQNREVHSAVSHTEYFLKYCSPMQLCPFSTSIVVVIRLPSNKDISPVRGQRQPALICQESIRTGVHRMPSTYGHLAPPDSICLMNL